MGSGTGNLAGRVTRQSETTVPTAEYFCSFAILHANILNTRYAKNSVSLLHL